MSALAKLHAEFNEIRGAAHVPPQLHDLMDELVGRFNDLEARVEAALKHQTTEPATAATQAPTDSSPKGPEAATEAAPTKRKTKA